MSKAQTALSTWMHRLQSFESWQSPGIEERATLLKDAGALYHCASGNLDVVIRQELLSVWPHGVMNLQAACSTVLSSKIPGQASVRQSLFDMLRVQCV